MPRTKTEVPADFLTPAEVAARLQVSKQALSYWRSKGEGPLSIKVLGSVRYPRRDFESWVTAQMQATSRGGVA